MDKVQAVWHVISVLSPYLLTSLLPSIYVGLTLFPQTSGAAGRFKQVMDWLSVVSHLDSPGTFKAPFLQVSKPPVAK